MNGYYTPMDMMDVKETLNVTRVPVRECKTHLRGF
jgi:hypothetical protein